MNGDSCNNNCSHIDFNDFNSSPITSQFPAGDGLASLDVVIPIVDDAIDEADHQVFIAYLMVESENQIIFQRVTSNCVIIDNDRECAISIFLL